MKEEEDGCPTPTSFPPFTCNKQGRLLVMSVWKDTNFYDFFFSVEINFMINCYEYLIIKSSEKENSRKKKEDLI